jgi:4-amino-4-deoxy-L-arabinose transferase-like glycosyltransferase
MKRTAFLDLGWCILLALYILLGTASVPFHGDESTQIFMSRDYAYQFLQGDLDLVRYSDPPISPTEQQLRLLNGTLNKYLIGFAWHLGGFTPDQLNEQWDWGADWNYNQTNHHAPSEALLQISRIPSALLMAAGVVILFALGHILGGRPVAYLASLYYAVNPALLINGRRAMMEGSLIAFSLLVVLTGVWLLQKRYWWTAILLGIAAGLALASKHNAVFTVIAVFGACALYPIIKWIVGIRHHNDPPVRAWRAMPLRAYLLLIVAGIVALLVFDVLNPAWWGDPFTRARQVLDLRADLLAGQTAAFGGYANVVDALSGFFRQIFVALPQYYEVPGWDVYLAEQIAGYEGSLWRGISIGGSVIGGWILLVLTAMGLWTLWRDQAVDRRTRWLIGAWVFVTLITTALLTPLEWQRYYLPAYPAVGLLSAYALVWIIRRYRLATAVAS